MSMIDYKKYLKPEKNNIIQIGSNDGIIGEEYGFIELIKENHNNVILIEPISEYLNVLKTTVKNSKSNIQFIQAGIRNYDGTSKINVQGGASSFKFGVNENSREVDVVSTKTLFKLFNNKIDLLLIDAEGCECEIIQDIDFSKNEINVIRFEYHLLGEEEKNNIIEKLSLYNYNIDKCVYDSPHNMVAVLKK